MAVADEPSEYPDLEKQHAAAAAHHEGGGRADAAVAGGCGWWYEYCRAKVFSFPGALALVFVLAAGIAQLAVWEDHLDYVFSAFSVIYLCTLTSLLTSLLAWFVVLPDPYQLDCCAGRRPPLVLAWAREVAGNVAVCSLLMMFLVTLVMLLAMLLAIAESRAPAEWTASHEYSRSSRASLVN